MNHRQGGLVAADFYPEQDVPAPTFFVGPIETVSDFGQINPGKHFHDPAPQRSMWADEQEMRWLPWVYVAVVLVTVLACHLIARWS